MCARKGAKLRVYPVEEDGSYDLERLESLLTDRTKILCIAQISNVLGIINPVREMAAVCHRHGCLILVDGAQGIVHLPVNVQDLDCDFYLFSGHKMYAAPGTGVLYGRLELLEYRYLPSSTFIITFRRWTSLPLSSSSRSMTAIPSWAAR